MCDGDGLLIGVFAVFFLTGGFLALWPEKVQKFDESMASFFSDPKMHIAFIRVVGYCFACLGGATFLALLVHLIGGC